MQIGLMHHVYSSMGGYRTIYASPKLPPAALSKAEEVARKLYPKVGTRPQMGYYRAADGWSAALRGFPAGTDHTGRVRTCIHTIFMRDQDLARVPWFNPFDIPDDLFMDEEEDLQDLSGQLKPAWLMGDTAAAAADAWRRTGTAIHPRAAQMMVPAMLEVRRATIVLDQQDQAFEIASLLAFVLPPSVRRGLTYLARAMLPPGPTPIFRMTFFGNNPDPSILTGGEIVADFRRAESYNDPERNAFSDFVLASLADGGEPMTPWRLAAVLERHEQDREFKSFHYLKLTEGFLKCPMIFRDDGTINVKASPADANDGVLPFWKSGCQRLAKAILVDVGAHVAAGAKKPDMAAKVKQQVEMAVAANQEKAISEVVEKFRVVFGRAPESEEDSDVSDTWSGPSPAPSVENTLNNFNFEE